jgi:hypothetical protein
MMLLSRPPILITLFFAADFALGAAHIINFALASQPSRFVNMDVECNLPNWYASMQWFCSAVLAAMFSHKHFAIPQPKSYFLAVIPLAFLLFSVDEVTSIHEWLGHKTDIILLKTSRENTSLASTGLWPVAIGLPIVILSFFVLSVVRPFFKENRSALLKISYGLAIMFSGAFGIEFIGNFLPPNSFGYALQVLAEELAELVGSTLILWGNYELVHYYGFSFSLKPKP